MFDSKLQGQPTNNCNFVKDNLTIFMPEHNQEQKNRKTHGACSFFGLNIRSLREQFDELKMKASEFADKQRSLIFITESWLIILINWKDLNK